MSYYITCPETLSESTCAAQAAGSVDHSKSTVLKWGQVGSHDDKSSAIIATKGYNRGVRRDCMQARSLQIIAQHIVDLYVVAGFQLVL